MPAISQVSTSKQVEAYVKELDSSRKEIVLRLRKLVMEAVPGFREELKWGNPCYIVGRSEKICFIYVISDHVNLGFFRGVHIKNPALPLEGTGKSMRHVKIRSVEEVDGKAVVRLVKQAVMSAKQE